MRTGPTLMVFFGNSWKHILDNKMWFADSGCNRLSYDCFPEVNLFESNCPNLKLKD